MLDLCAKLIPSWFHHAPREWPQCNMPFVSRHNCTSFLSFSIEQRLVIYLLPEFPQVISKVLLMKWYFFLLQKWSCPVFLLASYWALSQNEVMTAVYYCFVIRHFFLVWCPNMKNIWEVRSSVAAIPNWLTSLLLLLILSLYHWSTLPKPTLWLGGNAGQTPDIWRPSQLSLQVGILSYPGCWSYSPSPHWGHGKNYCLCSCWSAAWLRQLCFGWHNDEKRR